jgi:hypothetical protein
LKTSQIFHITSCLLLSFFFVKCANRSQGPQGGPKDISAPVVLKSTPENGGKQFSGERISITFDEFIVLNEPQKKIIVSPPQTTAPNIRTSGKSILIDFQDSLKQNTCYTIDFTDAIVDLNEQNPLLGYTFAFSTGDKLDTMQISGQVFDAETLNPIENVIVGIYKNAEDSFFVSKKPDRISRTNEKGNFTIRNVEKGEFSIYAFVDQNSDYYYSTVEESFAFLDSTITTRAKNIVTTDTILRIDTIGKDTIKTDSIVQKHETKYFPNDLKFYLSKKKISKQRYLKCERKTPNYIRFFFAEKDSVRPKITCFIDEADSTKTISSGIKWQYNNTNDTIECLLVDSALIKTEVLRFALTYYRPDSVYNLNLHTDTTRSYFSSKQLKRLIEKQVLKNPVVTFPKLPKDINYFEPLTIKLSHPAQTIDSSLISLSCTKDSIFSPVKIIRFEQIDSLGMEFLIEPEQNKDTEDRWNEELSYRLIIDSAAIHSTYGIINNRTSSDFRINGPEKFSNLQIILLKPVQKGIIELLDNQGKVVAIRHTDDNEAKEVGILFENILPGDYYLRLYIDENNDGEWTPALYEEKRQPEKVLYYPAALNLRANWDVEQEWLPDFEQRHQTKPSKLIEIDKQKSGKK